MIRPYCDKFTAIVNLVGGAVGQDSKGIITYHDGQTPPSDVAIAAEVKRLEDEYDSQEYARKRGDVYPNIKDQLDEIYHNGIDSWKAIIKQTKDKYPKDNSGPV